MAAATARRHINFKGSIPVSTRISSVLPLSARADGIFSCSAVPCADAASAEQQQSGSTSKRKRASEKGGTAHSQHAQHAQYPQQAEGSIGTQMLGTKMSGEVLDRAVKRSKMGLRALNEQHLEMSDAPLAPVTRELKAMTSVRGPRHSVRPSPERECAAWGEAAEAGNRHAFQQAVIVMETTIQQLQFELMVGSDKALYIPC